MLVLVDWLKDSYASYDQSESVAQCEVSMDELKIGFISLDDADDLEGILQANNVPFTMDSASLGEQNKTTGFGEFIFHPEVAVAAVSVAGTWLATRNNKKLRIKKGDLEIEATKVEEIDKLLSYLSKRSEEK